MAKDDNPTTEANPQGPVDTTQQVAQDIARQQNADAGAPWADQEERDKAAAEEIETQAKEAEKAAKEAEAEAAKS